MKSLLKRFQSPLPDISRGCLLCTLGENLHSSFLNPLPMCNQPLPQDPTRLSPSSPPRGLMLSSPAGVQGRDGCHSLEVEGAHRPREEYSLELDGPRTGGCCPALPRESCKNSESQQTAQGQDAEVSCTWNEASLPATSKICLFPMQGQGAASE